MTNDENPLHEQIAETDEDVLLATGFEDAFIGLAVRCGSEAVAVYDYFKCVEVLMTRDGMGEEEAEEYMQFNVVGAYVGERTPWFLYWRPMAPLAEQSDTASDPPSH
jgi:hypothetical protein